MSIKEHDEGVETQKLALILYGVTILPLFLLLMVSIVMFFISFVLFYENIGLLNQQYYGTSTFTLLLPCFLIFVTVLLHTSPILFSNFGKNKESTTNIDYLEILKELRKPTIRKNKNRKILQWILIILSILTLVGSQIYLHIGVFILLQL